MIEHMFYGEEEQAGSVHASVSVAQQALDGLAGVDVDAVDGRVLMDTVLALEGLRRRLDAASARMLGRLDVDGVTETVAGLRAKGWKANRCHLPHGVVARELKAASCLRRFTILADALATGRVSIEHVTAVANATNHRVEAALLQVQDRIVEFAETRRFSHFRTWLASLVELLDQDGAEPDPGEANTASMAADGQGNLHLVLELTGVDAVCAQRIINNETDRQTRQAQRETETTGAPMPTAQQLRARAVVELLRRGAKANPNSPKPAIEAVVTVTVDPNGNPTTHSIDTD
ncbi:MAG: DUF222 domain-containing protein, partial [Microthrixaceae bacterium]